MIEKWIYLACGIKPDEVFVISQLSYHNSDHLKMSYFYI